LRWAEFIEGKGDKMAAYWVLVRESEGNRPIVKHRRRWEDNIKMESRGTIAGSSEHGNEPSGYLNAWTFLSN
jgi:hypothetical protein